MVAIGTTAVRAEIGNRWLEREYVAGGDRLIRSVVRNRIAGTAIDCSGHEFRLEIGDRVITASDCCLVAIERQAYAGASGGRATLLRFRANELPVDIDVCTWASAIKPWLYKQVAAVNTGEKPLTLYTAAVEWFTPAGEGVTYAVEDHEIDQPFLSEAFHEAVGQPVFTESFFWGLEFPHSRSGRAASGELQLQHYPGRQLMPGERWESKRAVVGAAIAGRVGEAFDQYCLSLRPFADPYRFVNWECCWLAIPPTYETGKPFLQFLKERLVDQCGARLDAFDLSCMSWTFGSGIEGYESEGLWQAAEAEGHERMSADCQAAGIPYGMYFCANSFLPFANTKEWGKQQGFGFAADSCYCLAEPTYQKAITDRVLDAVERYKLGVVTFDMMWQGNGFGCRVEGHDHLVDPVRDPVGRFGTEAVIEAHLELLAGIRAINPEIIVSMMTYNWWGSPWWLPYVDVMHSVSGDTPASQTTRSPRFRDHLIAARDEQLYDMYVTRNRKLPMWGNDSFMGFQVRREFISAGHALNGDEPKEQWEDELIMATAGHLHAALLNCTDHRMLDETPSRVDFYADVLKWVEEHRWTLYDTRMILGDPSAGEPVGYAHRGETESIVCVRNNAMSGTTVEIALTDEVRPFGSSGDLVATLIYPTRQELADGLHAGDVLRLDLPPHQAHVVRFAPAGASEEPRITGARSRVRLSDGAQVEIDLWGRAGTTSDVLLRLDGANESGETHAVTFDGTPCRPAEWELQGPTPIEQGYEIAVTLNAGEGVHEHLLVYVENGKPELETLPVEDQEVFEAVPTQERWTGMTLERWIGMIEDRRAGGQRVSTDDLPDVTMRHEVDNGEVRGSASRVQQPSGSVTWRPRTNPSLTHSWYLVELAPGQNRVTIEIAGGGGTLLGLWLERRAPLAHHTLRLPVPMGYCPALQLPQFRPDEERQVHEIRPARGLASS